MTEDRKTEDARLVRDNFFEELPECRTLKDYREFMMKYFRSQQSAEDINLFISEIQAYNRERKEKRLPEISIGAIPEFREYFEDVAWNEFFRAKERFSYEEIQLGFMK